MARGTDSLITLGVVGVGAYLLYQLVSKLGSGVGAAAGSVAQSFATWYVRVTTSPPMVPQGSVYFQNGSYVAVASIPGGIAFDDATNTARFTYDGQQYVIPAGQTDAMGNWPAVPLSAYLASPQSFQPATSSLAQNVANLETNLGLSSSAAAQGWDNSGIIVN